MTTTLAQLRPLVRQRLGLQSNDGRLQDDSLTISINAALAKMATEYNWPWLITHEDFDCVVGQNQYNPPADWVKTMWFKIANFELSSRQRLDLVKFDTTTGRPTMFAVWEQKLWLAPTPDQTYTVTHSYLRSEPVLVDDEDTLLCPDRFIDVVVLYVAIYEARRMKDSGLESQLLTDKKEWLRNAAKLVPEVDILPRTRTRADFPLGH